MYIYIYTYIYIKLFVPRRVYLRRYMDGLGLGKPPRLGKVLRSGLWLKNAHPSAVD